MQSPLNSWISDRVGVKEENITFRSSPNFKKMKKYLKWRPENQMSPLKQNSPSSDSDSTHAVQPPLPLGPPPPESPPLLSPKKSPSSPFSRLNSPHYEICLDSIKKELEEENPQCDNVDAQTPLCRDSVRGDCKRFPCDYRHKCIPGVDRNDLKKVYKFCHDFQNFGCFKNTCKFVHANTFEEHEFYRTGVLPADCLKRKANLLLQTSQVVPMYSYEPPPPPPLEKDQKGMNMVASHISSPLSYSIYNGSMKENRSPESVIHKQWSNLQDVHPPLPQQESKMNHVNNSECDTCQVVENRMEYSNFQIENLNKSLAETKLKLKLLEKKYCDLLSVLEYALTMSGTPPKRLI